jgi:ABC-2 type transport system permease protein
MLALIRAEARKAWKRPAVWVCLILLLVLLVAFGYGISYFIFTYTKPPTGANAGAPRLDYALLKQALYPAHFHQNTMSGAAPLGGVLVMIIGVLLQGSEYGWGTVKTAFTQRPQRWSILIARLVVVAAIALIAAVAVLGLGALTSLVIVNIDGKSSGFPDATTIARAVGGLWLIYFFWAVFGFVLATLFRQSALAIGLGLAYALVIESLIFGLGDQFGGDPIRRIHQWFPLQNTTFLVEAFGQASPARANGGQVVTPFADATHAVVMLFVYCAAFIAGSLGLTQSRDIAS